MQLRDQREVQAAPNPLLKSIITHKKCNGDTTNGLDHPPSGQQECHCMPQHIRLSARSADQWDRSHQPTHHSRRVTKLENKISKKNSHTGATVAARVDACCNTVKQGSTNTLNSGPIDHTFRGFTSVKSPFFKPIADATSLRQERIWGFTERSSVGS